jgi:hypothetical protein
MKKLKLMMMMTLMMCLVGMTSYSQVNETDIFVNKQEVKTINFKLEKSSEYLIKSSSCGISQEVLLNYMWSYYICYYRYWYKCSCS